MAILKKWVFFKSARLLKLNILLFVSPLFFRSSSEEVTMPMSCMIFQWMRDMPSCPICISDRTRAHVFLASAYKIIKISVDSSPSPGSSSPSSSSSHQQNHSFHPKKLHQNNIPTESNNMMTTHPTVPILMIEEKSGGDTNSVYNMPAASSPEIKVDVVSAGSSGGGGGTGDGSSSWLLSQ